jgi:lipoprotein-releasing system permease protein
LLFELQLALKYLIPQRKALSTALISLLSVLVISLVIWLVLVFLSVTNGMEKNWLQKLTSLHAPIRITPTPAYYNSYYYQIDSLSAASNYSLKTIGEKNDAATSDPYAEETDIEVPPYWARPDCSLDGTLRDPVKAAYRELTRLQETVPGLAFQDYEMSGALLRIGISNGSSLSQMTYLLSMPEKNPNLSSLFMDPPIELSPKSMRLGGPLGQTQDFPVYLPKSYQENGVVAGDRGTLSFSAPTAASYQEQRIWVVVAGFYDPGILAIGNKCVLVSSIITRSIAAANQTISPDGTPTNGIFVWMSDLKKAHEIASLIRDRFSLAGIGSYWDVSTYENFEFAKDLIAQFQSDRTLLLLIASIILVVACSNIISLLVLLVNDKKKEIAILLSMGASFGSIASIFAICGVVMGALGCLFGSLAALFTLHHLDHLVAILSTLQGRSAFNPAFFGQSLPNQLSFEAFVFVLIATPLLSLAAGLIPALKASWIRPSSTLRSE